MGGPNQNWEYVPRKDIKTQRGIANPRMVIDVLQTFQMHKYLRVSDETTQIFVDYLPVHDIYKHPHFHLTPDKGKIRVAAFAELADPVLLNAEASHVTFTIDNLVATVNFFPE
jgi:hypothetical protein